MDIELDVDLSAQENANEYFSKAKKIKKKIEGVIEAEEATKKEIEKLNSLLNAKIEKQGADKKNEGGFAKFKVLEKKDWYERFHFFFTSQNLLAIGGKNAQQNEILFSKYFSEGDLFFHADIFGGSVVILKKGLDASLESKKEAAQFAAVYSNAWEENFPAVDVYALKFGQVKPSSKKGEFLLFGEREWFKGTELKLKIGLLNGKVVAYPAVSQVKLDKEVILSPGAIERKRALEIISNFLHVEKDKIDVLLPNGKFSVLQ